MMKVSYFFIVSILCLSSSVYAMDMDESQNANNTSNPAPRMTEYTPEEFAQRVMGQFFNNLDGMPDSFGRMPLHPLYGNNFPDNDLRCMYVGSILSNIDSLQELGSPQTHLFPQQNGTYRIALLGDERFSYDSLYWLVQGIVVVDLYNEYERLNQMVNELSLHNPQLL